MDEIDPEVLSLIDKKIQIILIARQFLALNAFFKNLGLEEMSEEVNISAELEKYVVGSDDF